MKKYNTQKGGALVGIIIILVILILGAIYFWKATQKRISENLAIQKALQEQSASVNDVFFEEGTETTEQGTN